MFGYPCDKEMLSQRAFLHMARPLLFDSNEAKRIAAIERLDKRASVLASKQLNRITGRHVFLGDLQEDVASAAPLGARAQRGRALLQSHAKLWQFLDAATKATYEARAKKMVEERRAQLLQEQRALSGKVIMSACRLTEDDLTTMAQMWMGADLTQRKVAAMRTAAMVGPSPPTLRIREQLESMDFGEPERHVAPPWCPMVCQARDFLVGCALVLVDDLGSERAFLFMWAMKSPMTAAFTELTRQEWGLPPAAGFHSDIVYPSVDSICEHQFTMELYHFVCDWQMPSCPADRVKVFRDAIFEEGYGVRFWSDLVSLADFVDELGLPPLAEGKRGSACKADTSSGEKLKTTNDLLEAHPWLSKYGVGEEEEEARKATNHSTGASSSSGRRSVDVLGEDEKEAVCRALGTRRKALAAKPVQRR